MAASETLPQMIDSASIARRLKVPQSTATRLMLEAADESGIPLYRLDLNNPRSKRFMPEREFFCYLKRTRKVS